MCLAQGPQRIDAGEAGTRGLSVWSQAFYHLATALPCYPYTNGLKIGEGMQSVLQYDFYIGVNVT